MRVTNPSPSAKGSTKAERVAATLRQQIWQGTLGPGCQLPTWDEMERQFGVGRPTLMRALERLKHDGFIYSDSTRGTFVQPRPPHLNRYALVFSSGPGELGWMRYWSALSSEAAAVGRECQKEIPVFHHVSGHAGEENTDRLLYDINAGRLAGIILAGEAGLAGAAFWDHVRVPVISLHGPAPAKAKRLEVDCGSFVRRSLEWLKSRGHRRVAVLTNDTNRYPEFAEQIPAHGLQSRSCWLLAASARAADTARNIVHLLMDRDASARPDALVVADDNLVESALGGLLAAGVKVPDEIEVVTHCNWPWPVQSVMPVRRLGFDTRQVLRRAMEMIDAARRGDELPQVQLVPAIFEDEQ